MAKETYRARVIARRMNAAQLVETELLVLDPPGFGFQAGQFVIVAVAEGALRSYSPASSPRDPGRLVLVADLRARGPGARFFAGLREGDTVSFEGPYGAFCLRADTERELLFVATGTGIAPVRSILADLQDRGDLRRPITLLYGCRRRDELLFHEDFLELARRSPDFAYHATLSRATPGEWTGLVGRVTAHLPHYVTHVDGVSAFLCGSKAMLRDASALLVALGMDRRKISREQFR